MCVSRRYPYSPEEGHWKFAGGWGGEGFLKAKRLEEKYETKLVFPWGQGGCKTIHLPWREYGYFLELHSCSVKCLIYCT